MKEIAENAAAAAHCALHLDCFKTFPHHDIPAVSHCTLCTAPSLQHSWPAADVRETALSSALAQRIYFYIAHAHYVFSMSLDIRKI